MAEVRKKTKIDMAKFRASTGSASFAESKFTKVHGWLDTGFYALNRIMSGNTRNGVPYGKIVLFSGESQSGKSYIAARCAIDALKNKGFVKVFIVDSEGGSLYDLLEKSGVDMEDIEQVLVESADECKVRMAQIFDFIKAQQKEHPDWLFLVILDSIGALIAKKFVEEAGEGKVVTDMGVTARVIGEMITATTIPALKTDTPVIMLNHVYDNPGNMMPQKIKNMKGGKKVAYMPRISVQCTTVPRKADGMYGGVDDDMFYQGSELTFFCFKNGMVRPFFEAKALNNTVDPQATKYYGLFDVAEGYGLIVRNNSKYTVPGYSGDKQYYKKEIICGKESDAMWSMLMPLIDEKSAADMAFGSLSAAPGLNEEAAEQMKMDEAADRTVADPESTEHMRI